jgi:ABC-type sugar transport system substrate-binding protein
MHAVVRIAYLSLLVLPAGCGRKTETVIGGIEIVFQADCQWNEDLGLKEMESALARFLDIALVYGHNDPQAHGAFLAAQRAKRGGIRFVGIDALPHEGIKYVREGILDATLLYPTCGAEAVDLGLLALEGRKIPKEIALGSALFTKENVDRGGEVLPAPGTQQVDSLRKENADVLKPDPSRPGRFKIGMSQCFLGEPWRVQMNDDIRKAAKRYPQITLVEKDAQNDADRQRTQIDEFIAERVSCLLVSPKETVPLTAPVARAFESGIPVIVLDRRVGGDEYTCFIGPDNLMVGKAAGRFAWKALGGKGKIVELQGLMTSTPAQDRHRGFLDGLREAAR